VLREVLAGGVLALPLAVARRAEPEQQVQEQQRQARADA
jgi:hypothetical protein